MKGMIAMKKNSIDELRIAFDEFLIAISEATGLDKLLYWLSEKLEKIGL